VRKCASAVLRSREAGIVQKGGGHSGDAGVDDLLAAPWVLAQQDRSGEAPSEFNLAPRYSVICGELYGDLTSSCALDENGLITLPDGTKAPYTVAGSPVFDNWTGTIVGSEPVDAGFLQYSSPGAVPSGLLLDAPADWGPSM